jgi:hypothetical protein
MSTTDIARQKIEEILKELDVKMMVEAGMNGQVLIILDNGNECDEVILVNTFGQ